MKNKDRRNGAAHRDVAILLVYNSKSWCGQEDSNFHASRRYHLKVVRLPISPWPHTINDPAIERE